MVEILTEALTLAETPFPTKIARLFLASDILHNSTAPVRLQRTCPEALLWPRTSSDPLQLAEGGMPFTDSLADRDRSFVPLAHRCGMLHGTEATWRTHCRPSSRACRTHTVALTAAWLRFAHIFAMIRLPQWSQCHRPQRQDHIVKTAACAL